MNLVNPLAAFSDTYNVLEGMAQDRAKRQAGNALAQGDYGAASGALLGRGMLDAGMGVQRYQQGQQDRIATEQRQLSEQERAGATERVGFLMRATKTLRGLPAEQRAQVLQSQILPAMANLPGFDPELLSQIGQTDLSDQTLDVFSQSLGAEAAKYQLFEAPNGDRYAYNSQDPTQSQLIYDAPDMPDDAPTGYRWRPDGGLEAIPGGPADPRVVGNRAAAGRAPPRPRSGGGGMGGASAGGISDMSTEDLLRALEQ
jgi:hypothetical protein